MSLRSLLLTLPLLAVPLYACAGSSGDHAVTPGSPHMTNAAALTGLHSGGACPEDMVLVEGEYCPHVAQRCLRWLDPKGKFQKYRCAEYARPATCRGPKEHRRYCIDRFERAESRESTLPANDVAWLDAKASCEADGARVCQESEWNFACEGEAMQPYPYGWSRDAALCNADQTELTTPENPGKLLDRRTPTNAHPRCVSPFGVYGMAGNVAEWVSVDGFEDGANVVQKGAWWHPGKHACRDAQGGHDKHYHGTETGYRCCKDAAP